MLLGSPEFQQDLVQSYYQEFLGRNADPGGLGAFGALLQQGAPDEAVIAALLGSAEKFAKV